METKGNISNKNNMKYRYIKPSAFLDDSRDRQKWSQYT